MGTHEKKVSNQNETIEKLFEGYSEADLEKSREEAMKDPVIKEWQNMEAVGKERYWEWENLGKGLNK